MAQGSGHRVSLGLRRLRQHLWGSGCLSEVKGFLAVGVPMESLCAGPAQPGTAEAAAACPAP